jgi:hypothetical protein
MVTPLVNDGDLRNDDGLIAEGNGGPQLANAMTCDGIKRTVLRRSLIPTLQLMSQEAAMINLGDLFPRAMVMVAVLVDLVSYVTWLLCWSRTGLSLFHGTKPYRYFTVLISRNASDGTRPIEGHDYNIKCQ